MKDLNLSASCYTDYAENKISKLQQAYLRKYRPQQHRSLLENWQGLVGEPGIADVAFQLRYLTNHLHQCLTTTVGKQLPN